MENNVEDVDKYFADEKGFISSLCEDFIIKKNLASYLVNKNLVGEKDDRQD